MQPERHKDVRYAIAVAYGITREVYAIDSWSSSAVEDIAVNEHRKPDDTDSKTKVHWMFSGTVALDLRERFVGKFVTWASAQNPIRWMNC